MTVGIVTLLTFIGLGIWWALEDIARAIRTVQPDLRRIARQLERQNPDQNDEEEENKG